MKYLFLTLLLFGCASKPVRKPIQKQRILVLERFTYHCIVTPYQLLLKIKAADEFEAGILTETAINDLKLKDYTIYCAKVRNGQKN